MIGALPLGGTLVLLGYLARRVEGTWVAPAPFWALLWGIYLICCAIIFPTLDALTTGALYILCASGAVALGSLAGYRTRADEAVLTPSALRALFPGLPLMVAVAVAAAIVNLTLLFGRFGFGLGDILSPSAVVQVVVGARSENYAGTSEITLVEWIDIVLVYLGGIAGGALYRLGATTLDAVLGLAGLIAASVVLGMMGSRMGALYGGAFWVAAYLAVASATAPSLRQLERSALAGGLASAGLGVLGISILVMVVRYAANFDAVGWRVVLADAFGFGGAFGIWLDDRGLVASELAAGARSLTRLVGVLGIREAPLPTIAVDFTSSNIYTVLRDVIEDFGTVGSLVVLGLVGWVGRRAFERARAGSLPAIALLLGVVVFTLTSFAVGVFFYTATTLALTCAVFYLLWVADRRTKPVLPPSLPGLGHRDVTGDYS